MSPLARARSFLFLLSGRAAVVFLAGFLALGAATAAVTPVFQIPDESSHWWTAISRARSADLSLRSARVCRAISQASEPDSATRATR